ncbi:UNVERIFIED_CONTAM: hypothetical protein Sindi_3145200 [Sesamum indicum]
MVPCGCSRQCDFLPSALNVKVKEIQPSAGKRRGVTMTLLSETTAKGTGLAESAGKEDPVELDSSPTL